MFYPKKQLSNQVGAKVFLDSPGDGKKALASDCASLFMHA
jgi:hypothetical protein